MPGMHRSRRLSTSDNYDDLVAEIETLRTQLNTTTSNLSTLRGTNNRLNDRISQLETTIEDQTAKAQDQDKDFISLRRQIRISGAEITRLRTEKDVLEKEYEELSTNIHDDKDDRKELADKVAELEEQLASALHLHVMSENRGGQSVEGVEGAQAPKAMSWLDLKAKLREAEDELDAVMQERDWLEGQLEKMIHSKDAVGGTELNVDLLKPLKSMASMSSFRSTTSRASQASHASNATSRASNATSRGRASVRGERMSLGAELGNMEWNPSDEDDENDTSGTERADDSDRDDELSTNGLRVPVITKTDDDAISITSSKRDLKDFALRLDTSGQPYRPRPSFSSQRTPSVAASFRSRISTKSRRETDSVHALDAAPGAPVATTAVFHEIERKHDEKVSKLQNDIVTLSTDLQGEIEILQQEVDGARAERDACILELQKLTTEMGLAKARQEDAEATLSVAASVEDLRSLSSTPVQSILSSEPASIARETAEDTVPQVRPPSEPSSPAEEVPVISARPSIATLRVQRSSATLRAPAPAPITKALEEEILALQQKDHDRLSEILGLRSEIDVLTRNLREKDALLRAEVVRLERDLDELIRDNRNMRDDAEINHFKVENLADELDRTRELLQLQAEERREFMEEIERLQARIRELETQSRRDKSRSPTQLSNPNLPTPEVTFETPLAVPIPNSYISHDSRDTLSTKSDFENPAILSESDNQLSESGSDAPPPSPQRKRRRSSAASKSGHHHHRRHSHKKDKKERDPASHKRTPSSSKSRKERETRKVSLPALSPVESVESPITPLEPLEPLGLEYITEPEPEPRPTPVARTRPRKASLLPVLSPIESLVKAPEPRYEPEHAPSRISYAPPPAREYIPTPTPEPEIRPSLVTRSRSRKPSLLPAPVTTPVPEYVNEYMPAYPPELDPRINPRPSLAARSRSSTLPSSLPRPTKSRTQTTPIQPPGDPTSVDKTYFKDLMVGGYALPPHEYNKYRRQARRTNLSMQIKVTSRGIESSSRVGTGSLIGVGGYADEVDDKRRGSVRRSSGRRRKESVVGTALDGDEDDEEYDHAGGNSWWEGLFRK